MKTKKSHLSDTKAARRNGSNFEDKVDSTVSEQVENGMSCSLVICEYGKVQELYETSATRR